MSLFDQIDLDAFKKYSGLSLPRHVAYPMPTWWENDFTTEQTQTMLRGSADDPDGNDLSLYIHVPFCQALCKFCACTKVIQRHDAPGAEERTARYVEALIKEIRLRAKQCNPHRPLRQIHWGGGTPTYFDSKTIADIHHTIEEVFTIAPEAEISIELDPRVTSQEQLESMGALGFNRVSMGVQDFEEQVQKHVRRVQPYEMVRDFVKACRELEFESVNFDLIYGLPYQTVATVRDTIKKTIELSPDRIAFYHYAQIPEKIATQRGMDYTKLPDSVTKLQMFLDAIEIFEAGGYDFIGLDHFARRDEMLSQSQRDGTLQRNFQGMTTGGGLDLIAVGASSISHLLGRGFLQNVREPDEYVQFIEAGKDPVIRGKNFTDDDLIRQALLSDLYCLSYVDPSRFENLFGIDFKEYFAKELESLGELEAAGLLTLGPDGRVDVTFPLGRVLARNVAAVFDAYLHEDAYHKGALKMFSANA